MPEFKQLSDMVEHFKADGCYILPKGGNSIVKEAETVSAIIYGEYVWNRTSWVRIGTLLSKPDHAIEWLVFKDGFMFVTDMATLRVTKIALNATEDFPIAVVAPGNPPFKKGDWCVAEGIGWAYVPLLIEHDLEYRDHTWWYGRTDI